MLKYFDTDTVQYYLLVVKITFTDRLVIEITFAHQLVVKITFIDRLVAKLPWYVGL